MRFWSNIQTTQLSSETNLQWVHALALGKYEHPALGELDFTRERLNGFADSVNKKIRGIDPDIDYDHKLDPSKGNVAAGWVKRAEVRDNGLWLLVEWTDKAKKALNDKEYRYFSTEFVNEWKNEKGEKFKNVILGGGLTNRPFLKNLVPVNLNELYDNSEQENKMELKELAKLLGLGENATEDEVKVKLNELKNGPEIDLTSLDVTVNEEGKIVISHPDSDTPIEKELPSTESENEPELAKLAEDNPAIAAMLSEHNKMKEDMKAMRATARLSEVTTQLSELDSKNVLPPVASNKFRDVMVQLPKQLSDKIADGLKELMKVGIVKLGEETASSKNGKVPNDDSISVFLSEVEKVKEEKKLTTSEASAIVIESNPQMYSDYVNAIEDGQRLIEQEA